MAYKLTSLSDLNSASFDDIIDVRAPSEFAEDHIPGAINLPVLDDAERARVGTVYVQQDRFLARKIGAALVARNAASHIEGPLSDRDGAWRPLIYCWRGGQRSGSFASILEQIGWRVTLIEGGYKSYRRLVVDKLYNQLFPLRVVLISGGTGTAKTRLLDHLKCAGAQVLDLEGLAAHRGSIFGAVAQQQPSQKLFESRLASALAHYDPAQPVFVEAESNKIGDRIIPKGLWQAMLVADRVEVSATLAARSEFLTRAYKDLLEDPARLSERISKLAPYHAKSEITEWQDMAKAGDFRALASQLIETHYDPRYAKSARTLKAPLASVHFDTLSEDALAAKAQQIIATVSQKT